MNELSEKLSQWPKEDLVTLINNIYQLDVDKVCDLIDVNLIKDDPAALTKSLRREINKWLRRTRFISYRESHSYSLKISAVRESIQKMLLPLDPKSAWKLIDKIVRNDGKIIDASDDSGGAIGYELNQFAILWLEAAQLMNLPDSHWLPLVIEITDGDDYGCRNDFLKESHLLLSRDSLMQIYNHYKSKLLLSKEKSTKGFDYTALSCSVNIGQVAIALKDPELYDESVRISYPEPNESQLLDIIGKYIQLGSPEAARKLLDQKEWTGYDRSYADRYYKEIFKLLGDTKSLISQYKSTWENIPSLDNLEEYLKLAGPAEKDSIEKIAEKKALIDSDYSRGFSVLIHLNKIEEAEGLILTNQKYFNECNYTTHLRLLDLLGERSPVSRIIIYRSLLTDILNRAYSNAYNHAAKYYKKLQFLNEQINVYPGKLMDHAAFSAALHEKHGRKNSFWSRVEK